MSKHRVPQPVQSAIQNVRDVMAAKSKSGWNVSIRNDKVVITAPDGVNLTVGLSPNQESLKKFVREAEKYNLIEGPARTPAEIEALLKEAEEAGQKQATLENERRLAHEAQQAQKKAEAKAAAQKAAAATVNGLKKPEVKIPEQPTASAKDNLFPAFDKALVGTTDYSKFLLPDGRYYCIECLGEGKKFTARAPQGLATHRGFRHQMYAGTPASSPATTETSRVSLPGDVQDAIDLLRSVISENLSPAEDSAKIAELEKALVEVKRQAEMDLKKADSDYRNLKETSDDLLKAAKEKVHQLSQELNGKDGRQQAETDALMKTFRGVLVDIDNALNNLSPVKAVARIDELITPYMQG